MIPNFIKYSLTRQRKKKGGETVQKRVEDSHPIESLWEKCRMISNAQNKFSLFGPSLKRQSKASIKLTNLGVCWATRSRYVILYVHPLLHSFLSKCLDKPWERWELLLGIPPPSSQFYHWLTDCERYIYIYFSCKNHTRHCCLSLIALKMDV